MRIGGSRTLAQQRSTSMAGIEVATKAPYGERISREEIERRIRAEQERIARERPEEFAHLAES